jgi:exonuclease III
MPSRSRNGQQRCSLRIATHNIKGLAANAARAARVWVSNNFDVIAVQEVHIRGHPWAAAQELYQGMNTINSTASSWSKELKRPQHEGFSCRWCLNGDSREAGVLLVWRRKLEASGELEILPEQEGDRDTDGRALLVRIKWGDIPSILLVYMVITLQQIGSS